MTTNLILLIDALGWELAERTGFLADRLPDRRRLRTILGYSSAAIPSLLTGLSPRDHGHWFLYFRARHPGDSPFVGARWMAHLPRRLRDRWSVRRRFAAWWQRRADIRGYFGLYEVPYRELADLDYVERLDTWAPGTFEGGSLIDDAAARGAASHFSDWRISDDAKFAAATTAALSPTPPRLLCLYLTEIDARQHAHGSRAPEVDDRLRTYRDHLDRLIDILERRGPVRLSVCSDHGMTDITRIVDPGPYLARVAHLSSEFRVFIDSTFLRFWPRTPAVGEAIRKSFESTGWGHILDENELKSEGVDFADDRYGGLHLLVDPGVLLVPSFMGRSPLKGMHGYTPDDAASDAVLLRQAEDTPAPGSILDLRRLFLSDLDRASPVPTDHPD